MWKSFYFDNESSAEHGLFITGEAVYNAPRYDYEFVSIQGRNGDLILDNGRFENIAVTYPCSLRDVSKLADVRTWLYSKRGYMRLSDDYNADEYRLACVSEALNVNPFHDSAADFTITFNCKPQRFLLTGEKPIMFTPLYSDDGVKWFTAWIPIYGSMFLYDPNSTSDALFSTLSTVRIMNNGTETSYNRSQWISDAAIVDGVGKLDLSGYTGDYVRFIFHTEPAAFSLDNGGEIIQLSVNASIENPTAYPAAPLIVYQIDDFNGDADVTLPEITINGVTLAVTTGYTGELNIDTEIQDAYIDDGGTFENGNQYVTLTKGGEYTTDFPVLNAGNTEVNTLYTGTVQDAYVNLGSVIIKVYPRYYTI